MHALGYVHVKVGSSPSLSSRFSQIQSHNNINHIYSYRETNSAVVTSVITIILGMPLKLPGMKMMTHLWVVGGKVAGHL